MWFYRRMLSVSYVGRVTDEEVLRLIGMKKELPRTINRRQLKLLGHVIRKEALEELSLSGKINEKRARGGQWNIFLRNFNLKPSRHLWDLARDRQQWRDMVRQTPNL